MEAVDTLISARWVIPIEPAACVLERHAVAIRQGRIVAVLPVADAKQRYFAAEKIDLPSHVLLPGLVNAHANAAFALPLPAGRSAFDASWADPEFVSDSTELALARMIRSGTTCFADFSLYPHIVARSAAVLHMRANVGLPIRAGATSWATTPDDYFDKAASLHDEYRADPLITTAFATGPTAAIPDELFARLRPKADEIELSVVVPLHASAAEIEQSLERFGRRPIERLAHLDLATPQLVGLHLTRTTDTDREILARAGAHAVVSPRSDLLHRYGHCSVPALRDQGINVALGTAGAPAGDLQGEMNLAALTSALDGLAPLDPQAILLVATLGGARALGLADSIGSLLPGKWADLCCIDLAAPRTQPAHDIPLQVVHAAESGQVSDVWVAGRRLLGSGALAGLDLSATLARVARWYS